MKTKVRVAIIAVAMCGTAAFGIVGASASDSNQVSRTNSDREVQGDHPECYDSSRMNNPEDYCYRNIGPWNSTTASASEVRAHVSLQSMIEQDMPTSVIQKYYPEYSPADK